MEGTTVIERAIDIIRLQAAQLGHTEEQVNQALRQAGLIEDPKLHVRFVGHTGISHTQESLTALVDAEADANGFDPSNVRVGFVVDLDVTTVATPDDLADVTRRLTSQLGFYIEDGGITVTA